MNLGEVCRTIYTVHKERVKEGVTLVFDNEEEDLLMEGDQNRIMQVITNFLTNASKFTYEGEIRLGFGRMDKDIRVYVKDTGIGIEPEKVDHIFERFYPQHLHIPYQFSFPDIFFRQERHQLSLSA